jgi:hypothetical protein
MVKCAICGADIYTPDYYAQIRLKYCPHCRQEIRRETKRAWAQEHRRQLRQNRKTLKDLCEALRVENAALRHEIISIRERMDRT